MRPRISPLSSARHRQFRVQTFWTAEESHRVHIAASNRWNHLVVHRQLSYSWLVRKARLSQAFDIELKHPLVPKATLARPGKARRGLHLQQSLNCFPRFWQSVQMRESGGDVASRYGVGAGFCHAAPRPVYCLIEALCEKMSRRDANVRMIAAPVFRVQAPGCHVLRNRPFALAAVAKDRAAAKSDMS